jgi:glycosyltransferase involved in cell wall biosynthesis
VTALRVELIGRPEPQVTGLSRYTAGLRGGLETAGLDVHLTHPTRPPFPLTMVRTLKRRGVDLDAFFASYPLRTRQHTADLYHLTDQTLATLLLFQRYPGPVVVTVMDIIPYLVEQVPALNTFRHAVDRWFYRVALAGLGRADALIAISEYTKRTLVEVLGLPEDRIEVVYPAIDHRRFRPVDVGEAFRRAYRLDPDDRHVLFVGSDDPRKNLHLAVRALATVRERIPNVRLLKVGASRFADEHQRIVKLIEELRLEEHVRLLDFVPDDDLPRLYSIADLCVLPSLYEGFGLPVAEAMACGTPVICARAGPLPEVAGGAAVHVSPHDPEALAAAVIALLGNPSWRRRLSEEGQVRAARFTLDRQASETQGLYRRVLANRQSKRG